MNIKPVLGALTLLVMASLIHAQETVESAPVLTAAVELSDGTRLMGSPLTDSLPVSLAVGDADVPLSKIRLCEVQAESNAVSVMLHNGDKLAGSLRAKQFRVRTILGELAPPFAHIQRITFTTGRKGPGALPPGEGELAFGGVNWVAWRMAFEARGDKLVTLPRARDGFNYGHSGNGRGAQLVTNVGSADWRDYTVEFELCLGGVDPAFNPHGLPPDVRGGAILFHVADAKESWNESGSSLYSLGVGGDGTWDLTCVYNQYCRVPSGFGSPANDGERRLAQGKGLKLDPEKGNKFRIEVADTRIQVWVDDRRIADLTDEKMREEIGGRTVDYGGVGFVWNHETMGWIRNFSVKGR